MKMNDDKVIRLEMVRLSEYSPFHHWENPEIIESYYRDTMMCEFKRALAQLKPEDILNIKEEDGVIRYTIDVVIKKYS